ncbi:MAG: FHA domain-containing protein [Fimbriimonadaceae bacterium]
MTARAMFLMLAGAIGGLLGWLAVEWSAPPVINPTFDDPMLGPARAAWTRFEQMFAIASGGFIGAMIGGASGWMRGSKTHLWQGALIAGLLGAMLGPIGVSLGSAVYGALGGGRDAVGPIQIVVRAVGWSVFGLFIGLSQGFAARSAARVWQGAVGGLIGGFIGGVAFELSAIALGNVTMAAQGHSEVGAIPRAIGMVSIGASVGLLVGIVEALSRRAWVRVILGRNEGKEYLVDAGQTFIGRDESAHIPLFGDPNIAPRHACIVKSGGSYVIYHGGSPVPTMVNGQPVMQAALHHGAHIQIGSMNLMFMLRSGPKPSVAMEQLRAQQPYAPVATPYAAAPAPQPKMVPTQAMPAAMSPTVAMPSQALGEIWVLVATNGPLAGQRYPVQGTLEVGRESALVPLAFDTAASRRHAAFTVGPGGLTVTDLGSTNGTFVHEQRVQSHVLKKGDLVRVGGTVFRVE